MELKIRVSTLIFQMILMENEVYISTTFSEKYGIEVGDTFTLDAKVR